MRIESITIFPEVFKGYLEASILGRAQKEGIVEFGVHNLRDFTTDKHKSVDDIPYGGGAGMVMKVEPIDRAVQELRSQGDYANSRVILFSAKGKQFTQKDAERLGQYDRIIMICPRYEGVDERVAEHIADEEFSIGPYVLTGGELPAMVVTDAIVRLLPGVLGNPDSLSEESHGETMNAEYPQYTRPDEYQGWKVPDVLLEGNHKEIQKWREEHSEKP